MTAVAGTWTLITLRKTPFLQQFLKSLTTGEVHERMMACWRDSPAYRHAIRVATAMWGVGLVLDAGVRVVLAYSLPVDQVPLINTLQYIAVYTLLQIGTRRYLKRKSLRDKVFAESGQMMMGGGK